jgi:EmrB/QacA subfamily drug resistance transporter
MSVKSTDRLLLANAVTGQFLSGFASRIFMVSLPTIAATLHADILAISWALIAYQLAGISLSVVFGRLGDVRGRDTIYGGGFAIMAVSSLLCGLAPNVGLLILFRFVQGIGAAMIASAARVLAMEAMPEGAEGRANGVMTTVFHVGFLLGPPLGGLVIEVVSWRWVFFLLVPLGVLGIVLTASRPERGRARAVRSDAAIDYGGASLLVVLTVALTLLLDRRAAELLGTGQKGLLGLAFVATCGWFVVHERRAVAPVVNFALFRIRMFAFSVLSLLIIATTTSALGFLMPFYLQEVLHLSPAFMGLIFLAAPVFTIALASASGRLTDRVGPRVPASIGVLLTMAGFLVGAFLRPDSSWTLSVILMGLMGLGTGLFNTPNQTAIIASVPREYRGFAAGMVQTVFGVSSLLGISLGGVLLTVMFQRYTGTPGARPDPDQPLAFVASMNAIYLVCFAVVGVALAASLMRGRTRIEAAGSPPTA